MRATVIGHHGYSVSAALADRFLNEWDEVEGVRLCREWCEAVHHNQSLAALAGTEKIVMRMEFDEAGVKTVHLVLPE